MPKIENSKLPPLPAGATILDFPVAKPEEIRKAFERLANIVSPRQRKIIEKILTKY
jgi:hypothetical protein